MGKSLTVQQILSEYIELGQAASKRDLEGLLKYAKEESTVCAIANFIEHYGDTVLSKRITVLDVLELHQGIHIPFVSFLALLPPMRPRQYSISSSALLGAQRVSLTVSVLRVRSECGLPYPVLGVASSFLRSLSPGALVPLCVRRSPPMFHLPLDVATPVVMFAAGSGIAPFRGFIEERAALKAAGKEIGLMVLFFGCRDPEVDFLYSKEELKFWKKSGVVDVRTAFSRKPEASQGCTYVQE